MEIKYITDTDFLPKELTHFHDYYPNEITLDLYQIVYGAFKSCFCLYDVYNLVVLIANGQKVTALRTFKLNSWKKSLKQIVKSLDAHISKDFRVVVNIPLVWREISLTETIDYYNMAISTIDEILNGNDCPITKALKDFPSVPDMKKLFEERYFFLTNPLIDFQNDKEEDAESGVRRLARAVFKETIINDEIYRRGIDTITINGEEIQIIPSQFYHEENKYKETFIDKNKIQEPIQDESEAIPMKLQASDSFDPGTEFVRTRAAVMFHMLSSIVQINMDNKYKVIALINYAVGNKYNFKLPKQETRDNTVRKYVDECIKNRLPKTNSLEFCLTVKKRLVEYGFDVPTIIEEGTEITKHTKVSPNT